MPQDEVFISIEAKLVDKPHLKAILYQIEGKEVWIPRSVHDEWNDEQIIVDRWFAEKEGL